MFRTVSIDGTQASPVTLLPQEQLDLMHLNLRSGEPMSQPEVIPFADRFGSKGPQVIACTLEIVRVLEHFPDLFVQDYALELADQLRQARNWARRDDRDYAKGVDIPGEKLSPIEPQPLTSKP